MKRVFITGNTGSGKTTLCNVLASRLNTYPVSLDQFVWLPGWRTVTPEAFGDNVDPVLQQDTWVIEGASNYVLKHADTVIYLDVIRANSYWRVLNETGDIFLPHGQSAA
jgi:adenylate kinase family enzyme